MSMTTISGVNLLVVVKARGAFFPLLVAASRFYDAAFLHICTSTMGVIQGADGCLLCRRLFVGAVGTEPHLARIPKWPSA
jgi:hypothetical protein